MGDLILEQANLQGYFYEQLDKLNQKSFNPLPKESIYYSSLVMDRFACSGEFFEFEEGKVREKILGLKLLESSSLSLKQQQRELQDIGDTALFLCGYFSDSLNNKLIDETYYRNVGKIAYKRLSHHRPSLYDVPKFYEKLAEMFNALTTIMTVLRKQNEDNQIISNSDILIFN